MVGAFERPRYMSRFVSCKRGMGLEQDSGSAMQGKTRRNQSFSGDDRPEAEVQMQQSQEEEQEEGTCLARTSQVSPRQVTAARPSLGSLPSISPGTPAPTESSVTPFKQLSLDPPITKHTLSELDVTKIIHNPKLRHDINFDPDLHS